MRLVLVNGIADVVGAALIARLENDRLPAGLTTDEKTLLDFMKPVERFIFRICGIDPEKSMNWKDPNLLSKILHGLHLTQEK